MSQNNQGGGPWGGGRQGGRSQPPDLEELLRRGQERLRSALAVGSIGGKGVLFGLLALALVWAGSGFYRVQPDEQGVVTRFGAFVEMTQPGLNYHLPWPIEAAQTPKVTRINRVDIGFRLFEQGRTEEVRDVPEESLILTGDENIIDVDVAVFWLISDAPSYLFNIQWPDASVKAVAESALREVIGRSQLQPVLTQARAVTEQAVMELMQQTLDEYGAGIQITQVQLQKVDPPSAVIDAFRDVQAARADQERMRNEAQSYANRVVPEARGEAARITEAASAYRDQTIAEAEGQADRFVMVYDEYARAPDVTRQRLFLETMERVFGDTEKIIIDDAAGASGVVPYLPLNELQRQPRPIATGGEQ